MVDLGAEVLESECMTVNPDYQTIFQEELIKAQYRGYRECIWEDHLDVMGLDDSNEIVDAFTATDSL